MGKLPWALVFCVAIAAFIGASAILIWALNTLFLLNIPYEPDTLIAAFLLLSLVHNGRIRRS